MEARWTRQLTDYKEGNIIEKRSNVYIDTMEYLVQTDTHVRAHACLQMSMHTHAHALTHLLIHSLTHTHTHTHHSTYLGLRSYRL